jgi:hypothetical protein
MGEIAPFEYSDHLWNERVLGRCNPHDAAVYTQGKRCRRCLESIPPSPLGLILTKEANGVSFVRGIAGLRSVMSIIRVERSPAGAHWRDDEAGQIH